MKFTEIPSSQRREIVVNLRHDAVPGDECDLMIAAQKAHTLQECVEWLNDQMFDPVTADYLEAAAKEQSA